MSSNHTLLHPDDDVFIALKNIPAGEEIAEGVRAAAEITAGHKIARRAVKAGNPVHRYNQIVGNASADIAAGDHVHIHNLAMAEFERDYAFCSKARPTQCGGSGGTSGVSCNPALGYAVDLLVRHGGTAILSETTEAYGAEHVLTARASTPEVGQKLVERIKWWEEFASGRDLGIML